MAPLDGIQNLIALLEGIFPDAVEALLAIPGTTIGTAQPGHDAHCFGEKRGRIKTHSTTLNDYRDHDFSWVLLCSSMLCIFFAVSGLLLGSFLNVCIVRLPAGDSIVAPRSHCRHCRQPIANRDNIPVLSWLLLGAACRSCGSRISWRYPLIELTTCALFVTCCLRFSPTLAAGWVVLCFLLFGLAVMDAETLLLPDLFTLPGLA